MSYPAEGMESAFKNSIDEVRGYLEAKHRGSYAVYNLSQRSYRVQKFENRVSLIYKKVTLKMAGIGNCFIKFKSNAVKR